MILLGEARGRAGLFNYFCIPAAAARTLIVDRSDATATPTAPAPWRVGVARGRHASGRGPWPVRATRGAAAPARARPLRSFYSAASVSAFYDLVSILVPYFVVRKATVLTVTFTVRPATVLPRV